MPEKNQMAAPKITHDANRRLRQVAFRQVFVQNRGRRLRYQANAVRAKVNGGTMMLVLPE
jgi:hypothetical protein